MNNFQAEKICASYGNKTILHDLSFSLAEGRLMGLLGANGCGKTTLLKSICGILPHQGSCRLGDTRLEGLSPRQIAQKISYIPQRSGISIDISALDVVLMGFNPQLKILEHPSREMKERARRALAIAGIGEMAASNFLHLSEGQKQLCILARTLAAQCEMLLLDEPESALDFRYRYRMLEIIRAWIHEGNRLGVVALHDPMLALNCCDELLLLKDGTKLGTIRPRSDSLQDMEKLLSQLYGPVCLTICADRQGKDHIVMLKEQEEDP